VPPMPRHARRAPRSLQPFAGGVYKLELFLPEEYPMSAPKVRAFRERERRCLAPRPQPCH
jgi:ubiquitin-protein ligase